MDLSLAPAALSAFAATTTSAAETITSAASADAAANLGAAAAALGPIGAGYLVEFAPAQANNYASALMVGAKHAAISATTAAAKASFLAADNG